MGLSNFPSPSEGVLPILVMNTVYSVSLFKNMMRSVLHVIGANSASPTDLGENESPMLENGRERRRVSITQFESLCKNRCRSLGRSNSSGGCSSMVECCCCVCLCGFEAEQEVSELSCKHFFHKGCLEKWFGNQHSSCPLCRSIC